MFRLKLSISPIKLAFALGLTLLGCTPVQAQPIKSVILLPHPMLNSSKQLDEPLSFNVPPPPDDINAPGGRTGGGKRGCGNIQKPLTALVPLYGPPDSGLVLGLTTVSHPTFWFYVPYSAPLDGEFVLQDEAEQTVYQTPVSLPRMPGVVSLSLPSTAPPLEIGKHYHWYFNIYCQPQQPPIFVDGWVKREELNSTLQSQIEQASPKLRVALYAANGIWYEALTASAKLRRTDQKSTDWAIMLRAVGLDEITSEPLVECCQFREGGTQ